VDKYPYPKNKTNNHTLVSYFHVQILSSLCRSDRPVEIILVTRRYNEEVNAIRNRAGIFDDLWDMNFKVRSAVPLVLVRLSVVPFQKKFY
jgi:hypothetical protein